MLIGDKIRSLRKNKNITQTQLVERYKFAKIVE